MKKTIFAATLAFWVFMIGVVIAGTGTPPASPAAPAAVQSPSSPAPERLAQAPVATGAAPARRAYTLQEVAQHAAPKDCWMVIHGKVYDFSAYIPQHPSAPEVMTRHCGKEATRAFDTKDRGRPHGDFAKGLLAKYEVGTLRN